MKIRFIGALGSVTGSCSLLNHRNRYYLVDCGAEQNGGTADPANGSAFPFKPDGIDGVFLTHAHLDHCGHLPVLVREGFRGRIYCTRATADLTRHALMDVAALGVGGFSAADVERLKFVCPDEHELFQFGTFFPVDRDLTCAFIRTSHVLGSVGFEFQFSDWKGASADERKTIVFSGDIGCNTDENPYQALLNGRQYPSTHAEYIVCESTYGERERGAGYMDFWGRLGALKRLLDEAAAIGPGATIVFPCFTLQRMQEVILDLHGVLELQLADDERREWLRMRGGQAGLVADVVVDSPLAVKYGAVFAHELSRLRRNGKPFYLNTALSGRLQVAGAHVYGMIERLLCPEKGRTQGRNYSLSYCPRVATPGAALRIVIAGAGMCNGGRVTEHLKKLLPSPKTVVALTGYQAAGTPGAELMRRATEPAGKINAAFWDLSSGEVRARIVDFSAYYSGHADRNGLLDFVLRKNSAHPYQTVKRVFLVHGENGARAGLKRAIVARASDNRATDRSVVAVELPEAVSGWFDLFENDWVYESHRVVDRPDMQVAALLAEVRRLGEQVTKFGERSPDEETVKKLYTELAAMREELVGLALGG